MKNLVAFDWDGKAIHVTENGEVVFEMRDQFELLDSGRLAVPTLVVTESTFESYDPDRRQRTIDEYRRQGHDLRTISPRLTAWWRIERGIEKSDDNDARAIWHIANDPNQHLKKPSPAMPKDHPWNQVRAEAERTLMVLRRSGAKDQLHKNLVEQLPKFKDLPEDLQKALGGKGGYSKAIVPAVYVAATYTNNIKEWERLLGLYASGKNSQFRSDIYHHGWKGNATASRRRDSGLTLTDYRRGLRWLYRQVKDLRVEV